MATLKGTKLTLLMGPIAAVPVPLAVVEAFESAQVTTAVGQRSGFQISFVYSKSSPIAKTLLPAGYFDPLIRVILLATVNGIPTVLADGPIKRQDVVASHSPGENRLTITGEDVGGYMNLIDFTGFMFPAMPPFARVAVMMAKYAMFGVIPAPVPAIYQSVDSPTERIAKQQGTDLAYSDHLAKEAGYEFYIIPGPVPGANTAYWGPQVRVGVPQPAITIDMDRASNIDSLSFAADGASSVLPYAHIKVANISIPVPVPPVSLLQPPLSARPLVPTRTKLIQTERLKSPAEVMARLLAARTEADPVTASGSLDVQRYGRPLAARQLVGVRGAGLAHDGLYYVRSVTSSLGRGTWKQNFQLARDGLVSNLPALPV
jgi:hypothetical protein